jgi:tetraacyldisaccharide 4'-kinase
MNFKKPKFWDHSGLSFWPIILYPFSLLFLFVSLAIRLLKTQKKFPIPIICVGNIYLGGTGKTPLALEIFKIIKSSGKNPGFIKKGYDYLHDEIQMLKKIGKTYLNKNRKEGISTLISLKHDVAILDDGFQDFSIKKDFSILCFNSKQLIGNGFLIPSGPLRESFQSIKRAECVIINGAKNLEFENKIKKINENIKIFYSKYKIKNLNKFKNKKVLAFAGIGNPSNFFELLKENNINVKETISYPDHHNYDEGNYSYLIEKKEQDVLLVTTEKDYYRLNEKMKHSFDYVDVDLEIENKNEFINLIKSKL